MRRNLDFTVNPEMSAPPSDPFSIRVFAAEGIPGGWRRVTKPNWDGEGALCPRSRYPRVRGQDYFSGSGVYLVTRRAGRGRSAVYIGEAECLRDDLDRRARRPDWRMATTFVRRPTPLNPIERSYLRSRMVGLVGNLGHLRVENRGHSLCPPLSEPDRADLEGFLNHMRSILGVLNIDLLGGGLPDGGPPDGAQSGGDGIDPSPQVTHYLSVRGVTAQGIETPNGFLVVKDSYARRDTSPAAGTWTVRRRQELIQKGVLVEDTSGRYRFTTDWHFGSPSAAAAVCCGTERDGPRTWKDRNGVTIKERDARLKARTGSENQG